MKHHHDESGHSRLHDHIHEAERHAHRHHRHGGFDRGRGGSRGRGFDGRHRGHRAGRGDIRAAVLALLSESPMHGYQMIQELGERSGGAWTPSPGSIYPALQLLQDEGLVSATETDGKRVFSLTDAGREQADARGEGPLPWELAARGEGEGFGQLRAAFMQVGAAVHQIGAAASEQQVTKAVKILATTRRELYRLLAEDDTDDSATS
jgi:DNA-binding PadR family transcriptional regulator